MEEPPRIERILSSQGISLSDTASILNSYLSNIDRYHQYLAAVDTSSSTVPSYEEIPDKISENNIIKGGKPNKSRQEREEEALIAQMDQLANMNSSSKTAVGMISDDIYERLKLIAKSIRAELEGEPLSASGMMTDTASALAIDSGGNGGEEEEGERSDENTGDNGDGFLLLWEAGDLLKQGNQQKLQEGLQQTSQTMKDQAKPQEEQIHASQSKKDKKREKKAKKAAKKAKKEAKRKAKSGYDKGESKRIKLDSS